MCRPTLGRFVARSMTKSWPFGLRAIASSIAALSAVSSVLARSGVLDEIGQANLYPRAFDALVDHLALAGSGAEVRQVVQDGLAGIIALLQQRMAAGDAAQQAELAGAIDEMEYLLARLDTTT